MAIAKLEAFTGLTKIAPANIEARSTESALRDAQYALDVQMLDLKNEFVHREAKIRTEFLERIAAILAGD